MLALRALLATGSSQRDVASKLGISQPAVSQQLKASRDLAKVHPEDLVRAAAPVLVDVARTQGFERLAVFGSVARGEARDDSDIDLLVDAPPGASIKELLRVVDEYIPEPPREVDKPFMMPIEDVFSIKGRGTVVTGRIERGTVKTMEEIEIVGLKPTRKVVVTGVEMFRKILDRGEAGDNVGCLLRGVQREEIERGQVLAKPGSITPHTRFMGEVYVLKKEEGGRHTPFFKGYRPQFYIRTMDVTGNVKLPEEVEMVMPGDNINLEIELIVPVGLEAGSRFAIREGGRTVGAGVITKILE